MDRGFLVPIPIMWLLIAGNITAQVSPSTDRLVEESHWKTFTSRAGWSIRYPRNWHVVSCRSCNDLTAPNVFVAFSDPSDEAVVMVEPLLDKPPSKDVEGWLTGISRTTNVNPIVSESWISLGDARALKVVNKNQDGTRSENIYVARGTRTFAIRAEATNPLYQQMLSTFKFIKH